MHVPESSWKFLPPADGYSAWADSGSFVRPHLSAQPQGWHRDGEPLWPHNMVGGPLPAHCINVFVPLQLIDKSNGATEFLLGSHLLDQDEKAELAGCVQPVVAAGTTLLFDYRISHRGGANVSCNDRFVLYFTYAASWFRDPSNHIATRSLFAQP